MRLICPNCDAEYLVDDSAIPDAGRDVQCSNCGHAWFQLPPEIEAALEHEEALFGDTLNEVPSDDVLAPPDLQSAPEPDLPVEPEAAPPPVAATTPPATAEPVRRSLDENILSVLREEAERESAARKAEAPPIEAQTELGLSAPPPVPGLLDATARRVARLKGIDPDARPVAPPKPGSRRELLPDIEEINSTLKPAQRADLDDAAYEAAMQSGTSGFRSGFTLVLILAAGMLAVYVMAPKISEQIPGAKGAMDSYVAYIDAARLWLDGLLRRTTEFLRSVTGQSGS